MADWRLDFCSHLRGVRLRHGTWTRPRLDWDHDHCAACWKTFSDFDGPEIQHQGFTTCEDYKRGANYEWVCEECFFALKDQVGWRVELT